MKIERLMFFGDSFAMEKSDKQNCWKTLLSEKLDNIPIGHWGQGGSSMESCYNDFYNYIKNDYSKTDLCVFCWTDLNRRSLVWENKLKFNLVTYLKSFEDYNKKDFLNVLDHFSPLAAIDFSNKVLKDLQEKYV